MELKQNTDTGQKVELSESDGINQIRIIEPEHSKDFGGKLVKGFKTVDMILSGIDLYYKPTGDNLYNFLSDFVYTCSAFLGLTKFTLIANIVSTPYAAYCGGIKEVKLHMFTSLFFTYLSNGGFISTILLMHAPFDTFQRSNDFYKRHFGEDHYSHQKESYEIWKSKLQLLNGTISDEFIERKTNEYKSYIEFYTAYDILTRNNTECRAKASNIEEQAECGKKYAIQAQQIKQNLENNLIGENQTAQDEL